MPLTPQEAIEKVESLYAVLADRRSGIEKLERYFRGDQKLTFASAEWSASHAKRYAKFADNWCGVVGSAPGERTEVKSFRLGDGTGVLSDDEKLLWRDWELNEGPAQASQGFLTSTVAKRSAVLVWGDGNDEPEMTWEHPSQVIVDYDPASPRRRRAALKSWVDGGLELATLYLADEVWKFERPNPDRGTSGLVVADSHGRPIGSTTGGSVDHGGWLPRADTGDDVTWPIGNPLGEVPIVEFRNRPMLNGEPLSDIEGTIAMQDAVNLLWAYLFVAADFASMPARVVMGQEPPKVPVLNSAGQVIGEKPVDSKALTEGRMLWLTGQNTKVGQWDAAKLDVFTEVINVSVRHIAAQTRTPIYLVHGELGNVNGETLVGLDAPLVSKVRESHTFYTSPMREVFRLMALVRDNKKVADECRQGIVGWADPETRSLAQVSDAAQKDVAAGWPFAAVLDKRYGLSQAEIDRIMALKEKESAAADATLDRVARQLTGDQTAPPAATDAPPLDS